MDILSLVAGTVTPALGSKVADASGVPETAVRKVMAVGIPVIFASLLKRGSAKGGMDAIASCLDVVGKNPLEGLGDDTVHAARVSSVAQGGSDMLRFLLGADTSGSLVKTLAGHAGIDEKAAGPIIGLAGSAALGGLKTAADEQGLDTADILRQIDTQKDRIDAAIPSDLGRMLSSAGVLPRAADLKIARPAAAPAKARSGSRLKWAAGLVALAAVGWLASQFFGGGTDPVATAAVETPAVPDVPVANVGETVQGVLTTLTSTLGSVTDVASANAAVESLTGADTALAGLDATVGGLSGEGRTALSTLIGASLPALTATTDGLLADSAIGPILKPVLDSIMTRLSSYAG